MNKLKLLLFLLLTPLLANANCSIESYKHIILPKNGNVQNTIKKSDCPQVIQNAFIEILNNSTGHISNKQIERIVKEENKEFSGGISLSPAKIKVSSLDSYIQSKLKLGKRLVFFDSKLTASSKVITLGEMEAIRVNCEQCNLPGEKNIKISISNIYNNTLRHIWVNTKLKARVTALSAKRSVGYGNDIVINENFELKEVYTLNPERFISPDQKLKYKTIARPLKKGELLQTSYIAEKNLVKMGKPASLKLKSKLIQITGSALPMQNGKMGEHVKLRNTKTNKTIFGIVTGPNEVEIKL